MSTASPRSRPSCDPDLAVASTSDREPGSLKASVDSSTRHARDAAIWRATGDRHLGGACYLTMRFAAQKGRDTGGEKFGWFLLGFFFPIIGMLISLVISPRATTPPPAG